MHLYSSLQLLQNKSKMGESIVDLNVADDVGDLYWLW